MKPCNCLKPVPTPGPSEYLPSRTYPDFYNNLRPAPGPGPWIPGAPCCCPPGPPGPPEPVPPSPCPPRIYHNLSETTVEGGAGVDVEEVLQENVYHYVVGLKHEYSFRGFTREDVSRMCDEVDAEE